MENAQLSVPISKHTPVEPADSIKEAEVGKFAVAMHVGSLNKRCFAVVHEYN